MHKPPSELRIPAASIMACLLPSIHGVDEAQDKSLRNPAKFRARDVWLRMHQDLPAGKNPCARFPGRPRAGTLSCASGLRSGSGLQGPGGVRAAPDNGLWCDWTGDWHGHIDKLEAGPRRDKPFRVAPALFGHALGPLRRWPRRAHPARLEIVDNARHH
jgi:hypothetical protein